MAIYQHLSKIWRRLDLFSLQVRLTVGVATLSGMGLGSLTVWTSWKMQQMLIGTHKQNTENIAHRFPRDVELYSEMLPVETGLQRAINNLTTDSLLIWVRRPDGTIAAQSAALQVGKNPRGAKLLSLSQMPLAAEVYPVNGSYWMLCGASLQVKGKMLGRLYIAQDITADRTMFVAVIQSLAIASLLSILVITAAIAFYVQRSLRSLRRLSQLAGSVSPDALGKAQLKLEGAPSEVKELAQMWDIMLSRLSQAWDQQQQFASNASHELRTPLTIVRGYLQSTLRRGNNLTEPQREALEIASSEADRTIQLLQDLLDLARADSGHLQHRLEPVVLNDLLAEVKGMAEQYAQQMVNFEATADAIEVTGDRNRLKQVLLNLIDNALKYSDPNQPITVRVQRQGKQAIIQVCDRGCGIPLQHQTRIFERFYRVDETRTRSTGGTGLGLSIVKTLVEGMGGSVTVRSKLGEGSIFTVTLPAQ